MKIKLWLMITLMSFKIQTAYKPKIQSLVSRSLLANDFSELRMIRPLATAAEALDSTLSPNAFSFSEACGLP